MKSGEMYEHPEFLLTRGAGGGFDLRPEEGEGLRLAPVEVGWQAEGAARLGACSLVREHPERDGFVLRAAGGGAELGRTLCLPESSPGLSLYYLLLDDGRMFRIVPCGPRDSRFELLGWEISGAYLVARPEGEGWRIAPTTACGGISDLEAILILFAAQILEADDLRPDR